MAEKVAKLGVKREPGHLYLRGSDVWKTPMKRAGGPSAAGKAEKVASGGFKRGRVTCTSSTRTATCRVRSAPLAVRSARSRRRSMPRRPPRRRPLPRRALARRPEEGRREEEGARSAKHHRAASFRLKRRAAVSILRPPRDPKLSTILERYAREREEAQVCNPISSLFSFGLDPFPRRVPGPHSECEDH